MDNVDATWSLATKAQFEESDLPPPGWNLAAITIHDHWLSEEGASAHWMAYGGAQNSAEKAEYMEKESALGSIYGIA